METSHKTKIMTVTKQYLERKVRDITEWLQNHHESHKEHKKYISNRDYYVNKLVEMDELGINQIELKRYKK